MKVTSQFKVLAWDEQPLPQKNEHFPVHQAYVTYELSGELVGRVTISYLFYYLEYRADNQHASQAKITGYVSFEGTYLGQATMFSAQEEGRFDQGVLSSVGTLFQANGAFSKYSGQYTYHFDEEGSNLVFELIAKTEND